jgi:hypothetical protein
MTDRRARHAARRPWGRRAVGALTPVAIGVLALSVVAYGQLRGDAGGQSTSTHRIRTDVGVHGSVKGLYPGAERRLRTTVSNRSHHPVELHRVDALVRDASTTCRARNLRVASTTHKVELASHERINVPLAVRMRRTAPDECIEATFPLRFRTEYEPLPR